MCWLVGPHILKPGYDNYQSGLAKECACDDCPVTSLLSYEDRCLSCYESAASKDFGCEFGMSMRRGQLKNVVIRCVRPCKWK